jgi:hypothetical protein
MISTPLFINHRVPEDIDPTAINDDIARKVNESNDAISQVDISLTA